MRWVEWENDRVVLVYSSGDPSPDNIETDDYQISLTYENGELGNALSSEPLPGVTYYTRLEIHNKIRDDHSVDFSQLSPSSVYLTLDGFDIEVLDCAQETVDGFDHLYVYYSVTKYQTSYCLKGVSLQSEGIEKQDGVWGPVPMEGSMIWDGEEPESESYQFDNSQFYVDETENEALTREPVPGQTYYFFVIVSNAVEDNHLIDFVGHLDEAFMNVAIPDYTVQYRGYNPISFYDKDAVVLHFSARRRNHNLFLVTVVDGIAHGTIAAEPLEAEEFTEITLTAYPDEGYVLSKYIVEDIDENEIEVSNSKFIMPTSDVIVSAEFKVEPVSDGEAYAVIDSSGNMTFFRSNETYENGEISQVTINGETIEGKIYSGVETMTVEKPGDVPWSGDAESIKTVKVATNHVIKPQIMTYWFCECEYLTSFNAEGFDTSSVTDMMGTFMFCDGLTSLDLQQFDTSEVTNMEGMFYFCRSLTTLNLGGFNTEKVENMGHMFTECLVLETLNISTFNTSSVTNMEYMLATCIKLNTLDLSHFDTAKVTNMEGMFYFDQSLERLDISSFDTRAVENMKGLFDDCNHLVEVVLGPKMTKWIDEAYLPAGIWNNEAKELQMNETRLYSQYPDNAWEWAGTWKKKWESPCYVWTDDNSSVTATVVNVEDNTLVVTETVNTVYEVTIAPKCEEKGSGTYTATFTKDPFETQIKEVEIPATGHASSDPVEENRTEPDCEHAGGYDLVVYCSVCHKELSRQHVDIPALGHD
ncbi:MAG: BspA family leucine-rich repeat surface protein, partial [Erysipelotrichaceae bacterium]|nr:BspA family leucine-rich repeat surface protein [Erysipelotrichaceae bacterium]